MTASATLTPKPLQASDVVRKARGSIEALPSIRRTYVLQGSTRQQDGSYYDSDLTEQTTWVKPDSQSAQTEDRLHGRLSKAVHIGDQNWFWDSKQGSLWINAPKGRYPDATYLVDTVLGPGLRGYLDNLQLVGSTSCGSRKCQRLSETFRDSDGTTIAVTVDVVEESWLPATATVRVAYANGKGYAANYTFEPGAFEVKAP